MKVLGDIGASAALHAAPPISAQGAGDSAVIIQSPSCSLPLRVKPEHQIARKSGQSVRFFNDTSGATGNDHPTRLLSALNERIGLPSLDTSSSSSLDATKQISFSFRSSNRPSGIEASEEALKLESSTFGTSDKSTLDDDVAYVDFEEETDSYSSDINYGAFGSDMNTFPPNFSDFYAPIADVDAPALCYSGSSTRVGPVTSHTCPYCPYTTPSKQNMNRHQLWHTGERPFGCAYCPYRATTKQNALSHMRRRHADKHGNVASDDDCVILSTKEESSDQLLADLRSPSPPQPYTEAFTTAPLKNEESAGSSNTVLSTFETPHCKGSPRNPPSFELATYGNSSESSASMDELGLLWATGPLMSPRSANIPARSSTLVSSLTSAFDSDQFLKMSRSSSRASSDSEHSGTKERMLHSQVVPSTEASTAFTSRESSSNYTKLPSGLYRCNVCNYEAMYASAVKIHLRSHSGEKPYHCPYCPYKSTTSGNVKTHLRKHTGETPFVCNLCNFRAKHKITLKTHMVNVHQITINRYSSYASNPTVQTMANPADLTQNSVEQGSHSQSVGLMSPSQQDLRLAFDSCALLRHQQQQLQHSLAQKDLSSIARKNVSPVFLQQQQRSVTHSRPEGGVRPFGESTTGVEEDATDQIERTLQAFGTLISTATEATHSSSTAANAPTTFASTSVSVSRSAQPNDSVPSAPSSSEHSEDQS
ncbi:Zinc finger C2H2-type [Trinorchestia longiramus]|nr:Zinc finger C2H2-type [Trinorchestia longiramus]